MAGGVRRPSSCNACERYSVKELKNFTFADRVEQNQRARDGTGKAAITESVWNWASRKFGRASGAFCTSLEAAVQRQEIKLYSPLRRMGTRTVSVTPLGDVVQVATSCGELGEKPDIRFYEM